LFHVAVECTWARRFWTAVKEILGMKLPTMHRLTWTTDLLVGKICTLEEAMVFVCGA
ncbi:hypothetical protein BAE44_0000599, partial [Dichanthelium oligosanthes]